MWRPKTTWRDQMRDSIQMRVGKEWMRMQEMIQKNGR
jgi:hypothetical protein